ncbi:tetratricopeptide (TPR) repeat protein [Sphingomonas insulae]|uniref:SPOR domain-containing protein n=1 Tax=Sphingomonas insulae TaxID=424800 RepID=A0ABN1HUU9_9SPHN|nr:tetratricopeptide repeat protein [Sphingomonas insulae]NIJ28385.1 tetratricopeptide (TPR) repeat protein [Sphingomonas insulae]
MRFLTSAFLAPAALLAATAPAALLAQEVVQALPGTTDADRLAEQMRALAANPRDLNALIAAADLSLSLGDLSGAASLFARAEKVSASDPRIKAGEGSILVRSERPGEALRYFAQAESAGYDVRSFAADRGLAYDLIGQQERAQRDYRLALKSRPDDEIVKRYALSLGISGKRDAALEQLDPLLRKSDRSAWRIRAFVLAMGGDQAGAEKIATTMLPTGMAQGLQPFFQRLPALPVADRAFAVHFGEVHATPERIADARLAPNLPLLAPDPQPVALAAVQPADLPGKKDRKRRGGRDRDTSPVALASTSQPAAAIRPSPSTPAASSYQTATAALARVQPLPQRPAVTLTSATPNTLPASIAPATGSTPTNAPLRPSVPTTAEAANLAALTKTMPAPTAGAAATPAPPSFTAEAANLAVLAKTTAAPATGAVATLAQPSIGTARGAAVTTPPRTTLPPTQLASAAPVSVTPASSAPVQSQPLPQAQSLPSPGFTTATTRPIVATTPPTRPAVEPVRVAAAPPAPEPVSSFTAPPSRSEADSVLARIVAGLSIPAAELGVAEPVKAAPVAAVPPADTAARVIAEAKAKEERDAAAEKALAAKTAADKRAADRKAAADKKALAAKKLADEQKLADAKAAAEEKKAARANPARIWVQVAGGAYAGDLPKAYAAVKAKAPAVFGSRGGWSTPLRATNRVLTGPFKTDAEARTFVNQLAKQGVSAFTFSSDAGQVITKLPAK